MSAPPGPVTGSLRLVAEIEHGRIRVATVESTRVRVSGRLAGRSWADVLDTVPKLFAVCGMAQGATARAAVSAARGATADPGAAAHDGPAVAAEAVREHLWRLMMDWPAIVGIGSLREPFANWQRRLLTESAHRRWAELGRAVREEWAEEYLGARADRWLEGARPDRHGAGASAPVDAILRFVASQPWVQSASGVPCLPATDVAEWDPDVLPDLDAAAPVWRASPHETGPRADCAEHPLVARLDAGGRRVASRLAARIVALLRLAERLESGTCSSPSGRRGEDRDVAVARTETARGMLLHRLGLQGETVTRYDIVAPTEWNFHPAGAWVRDALSVERLDPAATERYLQALALSLDPCVPWSVSVTPGVGRGGVELQRGVTNA